jgi:L-threonylcarbamoyladenylate synthase
MFKGAIQMKTEILKLDANNPDLDKVGYAAEIIKAGGLVAFPTETVYGLGANALDETAVKGIFAAKGRPADNPLIVHIADKGALCELTSSIPPVAGTLMDNFWPGPLTMIFNKSMAVPRITTGGLDTVAVRMPSHPVALALIAKSGLPIAAPSANTSGKPSPTIAQHVIEDLFGKVDMIIDAGSTNVGLESTVLDVTVSPPAILRPGGITPEQLESVFQRIEIDPTLMSQVASNVVPRSPGMKYKHYSPKAEVIIVEGSLDSMTAGISRLACRYASEGKKVGILATDQTKSSYQCSEVISMGDRDNPETIAASLFRDLREFDERHADIIIAEAVDSSGIGLAVMNRMSKAAGYNIIKV